MKLALFDDYRLGVVSPEQGMMTDVTGALPWPHDPDPLGAGWWVRLCRDFDSLRPRIEEAARNTAPRTLGSVRLRAPVLNPSKVIACAINYAAHAAEMRDVILQRVGVTPTASSSDFDIFLKAPSSIIGPGESVILPAKPVAEGKEIHHESELVLVIGRGGANITESEAFDHILGYTIGLDITVRGNGDRSRRKSYDTFTPLGPWMTTADEIKNPAGLGIRLEIGGSIRQDANTRDLIVDIPGIIAYASAIMTLNPGDVISTGAPPGVGEIHDGEVMDTTISGLGRLEIPVRNADAASRP